MNRKVVRWLTNKISEMFQNASLALLAGVDCYEFFDAIPGQKVRLRTEFLDISPNSKHKNGSFDRVKTAVPAVLS